MSYQHSAVGRPSFKCPEVRPSPLSPISPHSLTLPRLNPNVSCSHPASLPSLPAFLPHFILAGSQLQPTVPYSTSARPCPYPALTLFCPAPLLARLNLRPPRPFPPSPPRLPPQSPVFVHVLWQSLTCRPPGFNLKFIGLDSLPLLSDRGPSLRADWW
ncbi:hypothetical protein E2C01_038551 [Portunus trituberculatus]|uniref:Uncharacterized protein n=1 Tax=Portunus trituberculatus TaxID=210409 RepID=A0A5B7FB39_PORTR|nr:hypothetical protein [Portunus trituberculatus]